MKTNTEIMRDLVATFRDLGFLFNSRRLYVIEYGPNEDMPHINEFFIYKVRFECHNWPHVIFTDINDQDLDSKDLGASVFATRSEAEAHIDELKE